MAFSGSGSGTSESPYLITSWAQLQEVNNDLDKYFQLSNDLSSSTTGYSTYASSTANTNQGWLPLGNSTTKFTGEFDGNSKTISDLYIDRDATNTIGLFGYTKGATIKDVGIVDCNLTGNVYVGGLVGYNCSSTNCSSTITDCYSTGAVTGDSVVGGLVGYNSSSSTITDCYSTGAVSGTTNVGGLVGYSSSSTTTTSYWDTTTSGQATSDGGTGKTTAQMKDLSTFSSNWSIIGVTSKADGYANHSYTWNIVDDSTYPFLSWEYTLDMGVIYDSFSFNEEVSLQKTISLHLYDSFGFNEETTIRFGDEIETFHDSFSFSEEVTTQKTINLYFYDSFGFSDEFKKSTITTYTNSFYESLSFSENISVKKILPKQVQTKIEINGTQYSDYRVLNVKKTIDKANASSSFKAEFDSPYGRHKDDFSVGNEIIIYAGVDTSTKLLTGILEKISFKGQGTTQKLTISGRDYSARLQDVITQPSVYTDSEVSTIVKNLIDNFAEGITTTNINTTTTTLERIAFKHISLFDAISELAELSGFIFYVDTDKDLHFEEKDSVSSGYNLDNTNICYTNFDTTKEGLFNDIWVYGERYLTGYEQIVNTGSPLNGSSFILDYKPHNTDISYLGSSLKGGILNLSSNPISGTDYYVNFYDKEVVFISGEDIGYSTIPASGGSFITNYQRETPLIRHGQDNTSITLYGRKSLVIQDKTIKDPSTAQAVLDKKLEDVNPFKGLDVGVVGWLNLNPGETINIALDDFNLSQNNLSINSVNYQFNKNSIQDGKVITLKIDKKMKDITDMIKELNKRITYIEGGDMDEATGITRFQTFTGSEICSGTSWIVKSRPIESSFILGHPINSLLGSYSNHHLGDYKGSWITNGSY